jgi:hypothetical protein
MSFRMLLKGLPAPLTSQPPQIVHIFHIFLLSSYNCMTMIYLVCNLPPLQGHRFVVLCIYLQCLLQGLGQSEQGMKTFVEGGKELYGSLV